MTEWGGIFIGGALKGLEVAIRWTGSRQSNDKKERKVYD